METNNIHKENKVSEYVRNTGKLIPVKFLNKEYFARFACLYADLGVYSCYLDMLLDDPSHYGYTVINGDIYTVEYEVEDGYDTPDFCNLTMGEDGVISFDTYHHNGARSWDEVIGDKLKEHTHDK